MNWLLFLTKASSMKGCTSVRACQAGSCQVQVAFVRVTAAWWNMCERWMDWGTPAWLTLLMYRGIGGAH